MKRKWVIAGTLAAGLAGLGGLAYAASDHDDYGHRGPRYERGEGWRGDDTRGPRWRDDDRRGDDDRGRRFRGESRRGDDDCGGMMRGHGRYGDRDEGREHGRHGGMRGHMEGMREHGPERGRMGGMMQDRMQDRRGPGRLSAADPAELDSVKKEIGITAQQEEAWTKYTAAIKEAADSAKARRDGVHAGAARNLSPEDFRKFRDSLIEQRRKEIDAVKAAADDLVKGLDEKQVAVAKEVLPGYAFGPGTRYGMGEGGGMGPRHRHFER